ncbi:hypothetical protein GCM10007036_30980 [Alsobacter metallidurans]|uniref:Uncharacterized protein n=1 Tax=Alsobacter metallidurans TaxID=340221 RepID=A0A917I860_9HYPH|nr:hypothetical protein [Alsobacter metallidurans]GGH24521.1 hypothetical protein GCM10007036_30980 [Alsobacter metallidurans]
MTTDSNNSSQSSRLAKESRDRLIAVLLERLDELEASTHPDKGIAALGKDLAALQALQVAGELVQAVAGWAIDHQIGLAVSGLSFVPLQPHGTKEHPEYLALRSQVDDHRHEIAGRGDLLRLADVDDATHRRVLFNMLIGNSGALPLTTQQKMIEALKALDTGELLPIIKPRQTTKKVRYRESQLQLKALAIVEFMVHSDMKRFKAQEMVATAYGVSTETLRTWEKRVREDLGALEVSRTLSFARNAAASTKEARKALFSGSNQIHSDYGRSYSDASLKRAALAYRNVRRET